MPWGRLDDTLYDHAKVEALAPAVRLACVGLHVLAISWSNRQLTDGFVPDVRIPKLGGKGRHRTELVRVGLWEEVEGGVVIHDFHHYNKTRDQVLAEREAARDRMSKRRGRPPEVHANNGRSSGEVPANPRARGRIPSRPVPSRPNPVNGFTAAVRPKSASAKTAAVDPVKEPVGNAAR